MNMQALMRQAQNLQKDMLKAKEEVDQTEFVGTSSFVSVRVNGKKEILSIKIDKEEGIQNDELEIVEDMLLIAINDAMKQVDELTEKKMGKFSNMMPGMF